jgi:hypothetical protein
MSSPTWTSSPTSTTSLATCLSPMTTPTAVLHGPTPYVFPYYLSQIMLQFLLLSISLDLLLFKPMYLANCLDLLLVYYLLRIMINLIFVKLVMFDLILLWIKSFGKLLIFPT